MIHYHGGPISQEKAAYIIWKAKHAFVSFVFPHQLGMVMEICQSFALDNGAFSMWKSGKVPDWKDYYKWCESVLCHPGCDWAVIPDTIEGTEKENDRLIKEWPFGFRGVPVWHLNESVGRLKELADQWPRIALGSSGEYDVSAPKNCIKRLRKVLPAICNLQGYPKTKLHGMRMLSREIFTQIPLTSADSTTVARNTGIDKFWDRHDSPISKGVRGLVMLDKIEYFNSPGRIPAKREEDGGLLF